MKSILYLVIPLIIFSCTNNIKKEVGFNNNAVRSYSIDSSGFNYFETLYIPVYSEIYHMDGTRQMLLTVTLSIRNTSLNNSATITHIEYYDSKGKKLRTYLGSPLVLKPLESSEYIVEYAEKEGGAGASFIVDWAATEYSNQILVQAVMIGTSGQQGISFITGAKTIKSINKTGLNR